MSANKIAPWVNETCSTIGTGSLTLTGAKQSFSTFANAFVANDDIWYSILDDNGNREAGKATLLANGALQRTEIHSTYVNGVLNTTNPIAIALSGSSMVACTFNAEAFDELHTLITTVDGKFNAANILNLLTSNPNVNVLSDELYNKLVNIEGSNFKGVFVSPAALGTAVPTPQEGDWAYVDAGAGSDVQLYIWDASDSKWVPSSAGTITSAQVRQLLAAASDSNIFTDADKAKLDGIEDGAEANLTASELATAYESNTNTNKFTDTHKTAVDTLGSASTKNVGTLEQVKAGTENVLPDAAQAVELSENRPLWSSITKAVRKTFRCMFNGETYRPVMPLSELDATVAPPDIANRSFIELDGASYIQIPDIDFLVGQTISVCIQAPIEVLTSTQNPLDYIDSSKDRLRITFGDNGKIRYTSTLYTLYMDGQLVVNDVTEYPTDGLSHIFKAEVLAPCSLNLIGVGLGTNFRYIGTIYDLEVYDSNLKRIHYYPLRSDVIDELSGSIIKDPEFVWNGNWDITGNPRLENNSVIFGNNAGTNAIRSRYTYTGEETTFRLLCDVDRTSGDLAFGLVNASGSVGTYHTIGSSGRTDVILVRSLNGVNLGFSETSLNFLGTLSNFRIIPLVELSPSPDFSSEDGFLLDGGVTINTTNKQAVFGSATGGKYVRFSKDLPEGTKVRVVAKTSGTTTGKYRVATSPEALTPYYTSDTEIDEEYTLTANSIYFFFITPDGWDGNVEYFSVTEVTDGEINGSPTISKLALWIKELASNAVATATEFKAGLPKLALAEDIQNYFNELKTKFGLGTKWSEIDHDVTYNFETYYSKDKYLVQRPLTATEVALAPPPNAGRSFIEFDGVDIFMSDLNLILHPNYMLRFKYIAPLTELSIEQVLTDGSSGTSSERAFISMRSDGTLSFSASLSVDGVNYTAFSTKYPTDGLVHTVEYIPSTVKRLDLVGKFITGALAKYQGKIYDVEIYNSSGELIHYYPLRTDAVDYIAGNLVRDEEFTWDGNWPLVGGVSVANSKLTFTGIGQLTTVYPEELKDLPVGTYRVLMNKTAHTSSLGFKLNNSVVDPLLSGSGDLDVIKVLTSTSGDSGFYSSSGTYVGSVTSFRVIPLVELSPSADFSISTGFATGGGVNIDTVNKQAVFGSGAGVKNFRFTLSSELKGKKLRCAFKVSGATTGSYSILSNSTTFKSYTTETSDDTDFTYINNTGEQLFFQTTDGWDGNVEYLSVTEVTDGVVNGSPTIIYESDWSKLNQ